MKLALVIWFINFATTAEYYTLGDFFWTVFAMYVVLMMYIGAFWAVCLDGFSYHKTDQDNENDKKTLGEKYRAFWSSKIVKGSVISLLVLSIIGSVLDSVIPKDKNTIYLMIGAYVTSQALETCTSDKESLCYKLSNSLEKKITKALTEFDAEEALNKAADKVTKKVGEAVEKASDSTNGTLDKVSETSEKVSEAADKVSKTLEKVDKVK